VVPKRVTSRASLTQAIRQAAVRPLLPKAVDPVGLQEARVVAGSGVGHHGRPHGAGHVHLHARRLRAVQGGRVHPPMRGHRPAKEGGVVVPARVGGAELLLALLGQGRVLWRLAYPVGEPGAWKLLGEGPAAGGVRGEALVRGSQVVVEGPLACRRVLAAVHSIREGSRAVHLGV